MSKNIAVRDTNFFNNLVIGTTATIRGISDGLKSIKKDGGKILKKIFGKSEKLTGDVAKTSSETGIMTELFNPEILNLIFIILIWILLTLFNIVYLAGIVVALFLSNHRNEKMFPLKKKYIVMTSGLFSWYYVIYYIISFPYYKM